jgi:hypothetical protein
MTDALPERILRAVPHHKPWMVALAVLLVVVLLGVCAFGSYLIVRDGLKDDPVATPPAPTEPAKRDISDRTVDPKPLTAKDVFPAPQIKVDPDVPAYQLIGNPQVATDCRFAATGDIGKLLGTLGCNQVVRGTVKSAENGYLVTVGVFNLKDAEAARKAHDDLKTLVAQKKGRFTGYISGKETTVIGNAPTHLAWAPDGHFLVYCVIARPDGKPFATGDPVPPVIIHDLVERYLRDQVIATWSLDRSGTPSPGASAKAPPASAKATAPASGG